MAKTKSGRTLTLSPNLPNMKLQQELNLRLSLIAEEADDSQAVDQLLHLVSESGAVSVEVDGGDEVSPITGTHYIQDLEYEIKENEFITNPAQTWEFARPVTVLFPHTLRGTVNAIRYAEGKQQRVKALGNRHSYSQVAATDHCYIDLTRTFRYSRRTHNTDVPQLDQRSLERLQEGVGKNNFFDIPGAMSIHMINYILCPDKDQDHARFGRRRMFNMGAGDVQTFAGAFSTGTHGSGGIYSAYHDMVRSILVVASEGRVYRVEPADGITDPGKHRQFYADHPEEVPVELLQDDDRFYSLVVSMGCFGVIYSAIMETTKMTLMHSEATYHQAGWNPQLHQRFRKPLLPKDPNSEYFLYMLVNPYTLKGQPHPSVMVKEVVPTTNPGSGKAETRRKVWPNFFANWPVSVRAIRYLANTGSVPKRQFVESILKSLDDNQHQGQGYTDLAYKIWNSGGGKLNSIGTGMEVAFPVEQIPAMMELVRETLQQAEDEKTGYFLNCPIALRFVRPSKVYLAANYRYFMGEEVKEWCYLEVVRVNSENPEHDKKELALFRHLEQLLVMQGGRPHWGLHFGLPFDKETIRQFSPSYFFRRLYPKFDAWLAAYRFFNTNGTFDNVFTREAGLAPTEVAASPVWFKDSK
jgi:L-gulono-1,4-lactone dehydrogenase